LTALELTICDNRMWMIMWMLWRICPGQ